MLIGYVSDERYLALPDVLVEIENESCSVETRSRASGAIHAEIPPGEYRVTLARPGYGAKRVMASLGEEQPVSFRLLSDCLLGYAWPKWVRCGESAEFCVHSPEPYKLSLWRYGYEKELVRSLGWFDEHGPRSVVQITPDGDYVGKGVDWNRVGYGSKVHSLSVTAPDRGGLYYFHAKTDTGKFFSFPWIVSPPEPRAKVAVLTSNITWNAYNNFGGRSNYVSQAGLDPTPTVNARQDLSRYQQWGTWPYEVTSAPISFQRPEPLNVVPEHARITDPIEGRLESSMAPAEWRMLGWLEREGFDYDLYSETDLHFGGLSLDDYQVLVLNTHPEYWTHEMYARTKEWVYERGGRVMYLGGCGMYAEVEFVDETTMVCRREGETDLRGESEANLLGVAYTHSGYQSGSPYRVIDAEHWVFGGTGLKQGDLFGHRSLHERCPGGASGHELDKISPDSPKNICHLAKGNDSDGADMTLYETASGGAVFASGSLCWTLSIIIDEGVSAVTANVLRRFLQSND